MHVSMVFEEYYSNDNSTIYPLSLSNICLLTSSLKFCIADPTMKLANWSWEYSMAR